MKITDTVKLTAPMQKMIACEIEELIIDDRTIGTDEPIDYFLAVMYLRSNRRHGDGRGTLRNRIIENTPQWMRSVDAFEEQIGESPIKRAYDKYDL